MAHLVTILFTLADFALLPLRDVHDGVDQKLCFHVGKTVFRQVANLVHQEVSVTSQVEVVGASLSIDRWCNQLTIAKGCRATVIGVFDPNRTKGNLHITMRLHRIESFTASNKIKRIISWSAILRTVKSF